MAKENQIIRNYLKLKDVTCIDVADRIGKSAQSFSRDLRYPLSVQKTLELISIINEIAEEKSIKEKRCV